MTTKAQQDKEAGALVRPMRRHMTAVDDIAAADVPLNDRLQALQRIVAYVRTVDTRLWAERLAEIREGNDDAA